MARGAPSTSGNTTKTSSRASGLEIAVRVFPDGYEAPRETKKQTRPETFLVFDTETTTDAVQKLTFGGYRFYHQTRCLEEGLFYGDDFPAADRRTLGRYVAEHAANVDTNVAPQLKLHSRSEFVRSVFYRAAFKARSMVVCFNTPFDLSRIAVAGGQARYRRPKKPTKNERPFDYAGGFSFALWQFSKDGKWHINRYRPRIRIKSIDSKRALKAFARPDELDEEDMIPDWVGETTVDEGFTFRGHFLDMRTLVFALTDKGHTLESACEAFGVEHGKTKPGKHGEVTPEYINYNRRDVLATSELLFKALEEYDRHPIDLQPTKAYSPASIGKAYLRSMGIKPILGRQDFPKDVLGHSMVAFYGGRTECHVRKVPVPIVYLDFLSMYPTVNALMGLWEILTAGTVKTIEATSEVQSFIEGMTVEKLFLPETWKEFVGLALVEPSDDVMPIRAVYDPATHSWQIGVNHLVQGASRKPLWFSFADVAASKIITNKSPTILRAIRIKPRGKLKHLRATSPRGAFDVDPTTEDFFRKVIELRKSLGSYSSVSDKEKERLDLFLKILANATSYGISAEIIRHELPGKTKADQTLYALDENPFQATVRALEEAGEFCFPPLAACITGGARLMLALLERCVTDEGGTYAMCDTDSMGVIASRGGDLVACPGGPHRLPNGRAGIRALGWDMVEKIRNRFASLNPYDQKFVHGSVLELEKDNRDPRSGKSRQLWCYAISAKRYAIFLINKKGEPELLQKKVNNETDGWSEHGFGHLLNPTDSDSEDRGWIRQAWENLIREALGLPTNSLSWLNRPAVARVSVSSPFVHRAFRTLNDGKHYSDQIKPFNFILSAHVAPFGYPEGVDPGKFHLIAPFNKDPAQWTKLRWVDMHSGRSFHISSVGEARSEGIVRVKNYGDVLEDYKYHPESKSLAPIGEPCQRQDVGLLGRRTVAPLWIRYIGKESNELETAAAGMVHDPSNVYAEYVDPSRNYWLEVILPILRKIPLKLLVEESGMSASALKAIRREEDAVVPHVRNREKLNHIALTWNNMQDPRLRSG